MVQIKTGNLAERAQYFKACEHFFFCYLEGLRKRVTASPPCFTCPAVFAVRLPSAGIMCSVCPYGKGFFHLFLVTSTFLHY